MNSAYSDTGFVVRVVDSGEADKYVSILSENHGLVTFIARGARRPQSKKSPHLDLLNLIKFSAGRGDSPQFLNQTESIVFYPKIKSDFTKVGTSFAIFEILNASLPHNLEDREIFLSLKVFLDSLEESQDKREINGLTRKFALYLLRHLGFPPPKNPESDNLSAYFESIMNRKIISKDIK